MNKPYFDFGDFLKLNFPYKVQKIAINAGFTCPNRDGTKGTGGCSYCNNQTFNPDYCKPELTITEQLEKGKKFFARKYPEMKYLAYFQAYTNTYSELTQLRAMYEEALQVEDVVGIIIGTRPDCVPDQLLDYLAELSKTHFVLMEYGAESANNDTLKTINRGHTWEETVDAVQRTKQRGLMCGLHIIMGLPGETEEDFMRTADCISELPIETLKIHQLQLIKGTKMAHQVEKGEVKIMQFDVDTYIDLCINFIKRIRSGIALERFVSQSPEALLISPRWGLKNYEFTNKLNAKIQKDNVKQGQDYQPKTEN